MGFMLTFGFTASKIFFNMCYLNSLHYVSEEYPSYGTTAFHMASENGHVMIVHALLDAGVDMETADSTKQTIFSKFMYLHVYMSICLSVKLFIHLLSICLSVCLSICL